MASRDGILVSRTLYQIGMITLITVIVWVIVGIYRVNSQKINLDVDKSVLQPISLELDEEVVEALQNRLKVGTLPPTPAPVLLIEEAVTEAPVSLEPLVGVEEDIAQ